MEGKNKRLVIIGLLALFACVVVSVLAVSVFSPGYYVWVMDRGDGLDDWFLVKMCPNGTRQVLVQFGQSGAIGIDPRDGSLWAPELNTEQSIFSDQLVKISEDWSVIQRFPGYRTGVLAVDANDGNVWVGLPNQHEVVKLDSEGNSLLAVGGISGPASIVINPNDSSVWVADYAPPATIIHLNSTGDELFRVHTSGFYSNTPHQLSLYTMTGDLWFVSGNSVFKLSPQGELLSVADGFDRPTSIAVNQKDGTVWVADFSVDGPGAIVKLNPQGEMVMKLVTETPPRLVSVDPFDRAVWVGVEGALLKLTTDGEIQMEIKSIRQPYSIGFAKSNRDLWTRVNYFMNCRTGF